MSSSQRGNIRTAAVIPIALAIAILISVALVLRLAPSCRGNYRWKIGGSEYFLFECIAPVPEPKVDCDASGLRGESILLHFSQNKAELAVEAKRLLEGAGALVEYAPKQDTGPYHDYVVYTWRGNRPDLARAVLQCLSKLEQFKKEGKIDGRTEKMGESWQRFGAIVYLVDQ